MSYHSENMICFGAKVSLKEFVDSVVTFDNIPNKDYREAHASCDHYTSESDILATCRQNIRYCSFCGTPLEWIPSNNSVVKQFVLKPNVFIEWFQDFNNCGFTDRSGAMEYLKYKIYDNISDMLVHIGELYGCKVYFTSNGSFDISNNTDEYIIIVYNFIHRVSLDEYKDISVKSIALESVQINDKDKDHFNNMLKMMGLQQQLSLICTNIFY